MKKLSCVSALAAILASLCVCPLAASQEGPAEKQIQKNPDTPMHAKGSFEVKLTPQSPDGKFEDATLGRMTLEKQFHGDLTGTSTGQMLTASTEVKGSGAYVAIERITGSLQGRSGSFILQHTGTMTRGAPQLNIVVVPDSGTGQLAGISGKMNIIIEQGKHSYDFEYTLPQAP